MSTILDRARTVSVTEANARGISGLVKDAEDGSDVIVERHGRPVAAVVSTRHLDELRTLEGDLRDAALIVVRAATDSGVRAPLDEAIAAFGLDRAELEAEIEAERIADAG